MANLELIKPTIRAILMALGNQATEREFRGEFFNQEGESFNVVLREHRLTFYEFMKNLSDVCRVSMLGDEVYVQKVSDENSRHMDSLTVVKKKKKLPFRFNPVRSAFSTTGRPYARQPFTKRLNSQPARAAVVPSPLNKPPAHVKTPYAAPKQSYTQYQKEKAKLSTLPPAPHMLAKAIVYSTPQESKTDDEKASFESKPTTEKNVQQSKPCVENNQPRVENSKPREDFSSEDKENKKTTPKPFADAPLDSKPPTVATPVKNKESNKPCEAISLEEKERREKAAWNHAFLLRSNDIKLQRGADLMKQRAPVQAPLLRDSRNVVVISDDEQPRNLVITVSNEQHRSVKPQTAGTERPVLKEGSFNAREVLDSKKPLDKSQEVDKIKQLEAEIQRREEKIQLLKEALPSRPVSRANSVVEVDDSITLSKTPVPYPKVKELQGGRKQFFVSLIEIISPSQFCFQFNEKELMALTTEMTLFYDNQKGALRVPRSSLAAGQTVALREGNHWLRVEIVYVSGEDVLIYNIDFGTKRKAKVTEGFSFLTEEFAAPTRKASKGCLHGVKPSEGVLWSPAAIMAFMTKAKGVKILATVKAVADQTFELSLTYNGIQNATVEDYLLQRKLAQPSKTNQPTMNAILF